MKNFGTIENSTMARTDSFFAIFPFLICLALVLPEFRSNGQENSRMVQWKSHLTKFPIIENCIFERETPAVSGDRFSTRAETNFYQFRFQDNGLFVRQIENAEQASVDHTPPLGLFVGCYGKDCWSISAGNILKLFPDGGDFTAFPRDERAVIFAADRMVYSVLCYGINFLDPTTLKWLDQTNFSARSVLGEDYLGQIIRMENGLPRVLKWHSTKAPEKKFIIRYGYNQSPDLTYFPRSMEISLDMGKEEMVVGAYKILFLKTTSAPLDSSYFDHKRYYTSDSSPMTKTFVFTNGELYGLRGGRLESVLPMSQMDLKGPLEKRKYIKTVRTAVWAFIGASIVGVLLLAVRFSKQKNNEGKQ